MEERGELLIDSEIEEDGGDDDDYEKLEEGDSFYENESHFVRDFEQLQIKYDCRSYSMADYVSRIYEKREIESSILYSVHFVSVQESSLDLTDVSMAEYTDYPTDISDQSGAKAVPQESVYASVGESVSSNLPNYVVSASSNGKILIYKFEDLISNSYDSSINSKKLSLSLEAHEGCVFDTKFSNLNSESYLFSCGEDGKVYGWKWNDFNLNNDNNMINYGEDSIYPVFEFQNKQKRGVRHALKEIAQTNCIAIDTMNKIVYGGTGDGTINAFDLESEKCVLSFSGHLGAVNTLAFLESKSHVISGSSDGTVRIWDCRDGSKNIACLDPFNAKFQTNESKKGKKYSINCLAVDKRQNWMVCGSQGQTLTLFSLRDLSAALRISTNFFPRALQIVDDEILAGGSQPLISRFDFNGKSTAKIVSFSESIFSIAHHPFGLMAVGGYGGILDIITNYGSHLCTFRSH